MKTNPNDPINSMLGFKSKDLEAMEAAGILKGLTKREHFAVHADVTDEMVDMKREFIATLINRDIDNSDALDIIRAHCECEAVLKVMKADALIAELNKEVKP